MLPENFKLLRGQGFFPLFFGFDHRLGGLDGCTGVGFGLWAIALGGLLLAVGSGVTAGKLEEGDPGNEG